MATAKSANFSLGGEKMGARRLLSLIIILLASTTVQAQNTPPPSTIAYISTDYNVYSLHPETNSHTQLTEDGSETAPYMWPTWSTDGRLAYFQSTTTNGLFTTRAYVSSDGNTRGTLVYEGTEAVFNYAYWSPQNCNEDDNCRDLAILLSTTDGLGIQLIRNSTNETTSQLIGRGAPFYYSWSPDGKQMLWQRNNQRIDIYDVDTNSITDTLPQQPGIFSTPAWSPVDDRLMLGTLNAETQTTDLIIIANEETITLAPELTGVVYFEWSPDGNKAAYTNQRGRLTIVDTITGEPTTRSSESGVLAFFWSPDSSHIAYITLATPPDSISTKANTNNKHPQSQETPGIAWSIMDATDGSTRRYGSFIPTREMLYMLIYFDQFSQSHRVWSPDSRYLLYSEITPNNRTSINILDTTQTNVVPLSVAEGYIGIWSFN